MTPVAVTVLEAAAMLHCCRARVFELLAAGDLERAQSAGRATLVLTDSIEAYLRAGRPAERPAVKRVRSRPARVEVLRAAFRRGVDEAKR